MSNRLFEPGGEGHEVEPTSDARIAPGRISLTHHMTGRAAAPEGRSAPPEEQSATPWVPEGGGGGASSRATTIQALSTADPFDFSFGSPSHDSFRPVQAKKGPAGLDPERVHQAAQHG